MVVATTERLLLLPAGHGLLFALLLARKTGRHGPRDFLALMAETGLLLVLSVTNKEGAVQRFSLVYAKAKVRSCVAVDVPVLSLLGVPTSTTILLRPPAIIT